MGSPVQILRSNSDHLRVSPDIWNLFKSIYGGGPEVILKPNGVSIVIPTASPGMVTRENSKFFIFTAFHREKQLSNKRAL